MWLKDVLVSTGCPLPTSLLFNIIALNSAISANPPQPNCQDTPEQYGAGTIHMLNKSIRGKEKKAVAKQRNNSMPVTILPSLCGSRMCWSAQDVLCQQVYFSTSLPSILPSLQILPNLIVKTLQNNMEQAPFTCSTSLSEGKKRKPWPNKETTACQLQYFQACVAQGCVGQHRMSSANKFTFNIIALNSAISANSPQPNSQRKFEWETSELRSLNMRENSRVEKNRIE